MAAQKDNSYRLLWMLGLALTLPMILLSGPLAGYLIGSVLVKKAGLPLWTPPVSMVLGLVGSGWQAYQLIQKLKNSLNEK